MVIVTTLYYFKSWKFTYSVIKDMKSLHEKDPSPNRRRSPVRPGHASKVVGPGAISTGPLRCFAPDAHRALSSSSLVWRMTLWAICHMSAFEAMYAEKIIPPNVQSLLKIFATFFYKKREKKCNFTRLCYWSRRHTVTNLPLSGTRWLNLQHCISRVLEMWDIIEDALEKFKVT